MTVFDLARRGDIVLVLERDGGAIAYLRDKERGVIKHIAHPDVRCAGALGELIDTAKRDAWGMGDN